METTDTQAADILTFWFEECPPSKRFQVDLELDETIRTRFGDLHDQLSQSIPPAWLETKERRLAAIILLDQWSRNLYRGQGKAFAQDAAGLELAQKAVALGDLDAWPSNKASFIVMPYMHAEDLDTVEQSITLMRQIGEERSAVFAELHRDSIAKFGRYPARNKALGRETTPEEAAFLEKNPSGF